MYLTTQLQPTDTGPARSSTDPISIAVCHTQRNTPVQITGVTQPWPHKQGRWRTCYHWAVEVGMSGGLPLCGGGWMSMEVGMSGGLPLCGGGWMSMEVGMSEGLPLCGGGWMSMEVGMSEGLPLCGGGWMSMEVGMSEGLPLCGGGWMSMEVEMFEGLTQWEERLENVLPLNYGGGDV